MISKSPSLLEEDGYVRKFVGLDLKSSDGALYVRMAQDLLDIFFNETDVQNEIEKT